MAGLKQFAERMKLGAAQITAIGAFREVTLGYFDWEKKEYQKIPVNEQVEVLSMIGDVAQEQGKPKVHVHVVVGRSDGTTRGGHLMEAHVRPTLEVILTESPRAPAQGARRRIGSGADPTVRTRALHYHEAGEP